MNAAAPAAVYLKLDWPGAYFFVQNQLLKKYLTLSFQYAGDREALKK